MAHAIFCAAQASLAEARAQREAAESRTAQERALLEQALQRELERASGLQASLLQAQKAKARARRAHLHAPDPKICDGLSSAGKSCNYAGPCYNMQICSVLTLCQGAARHRHTVAQRERDQDTFSVRPGRSEPLTATRKQCAGAVRLYK